MGPDRVPDLLIKSTHQIEYGHFLFFRGGDRLQKATMRQLDKDRGEERHHLCPRILWEDLADIVDIEWIYFNKKKLK